MWSTHGARCVVKLKLPIKLRSVAHAKPSQKLPIKNCDGIFELKIYQAKYKLIRKTRKKFKILEQMMSYQKIR